MFEGATYPGVETLNQVHHVTARPGEPKSAAAAPEVATAAGGASATPIPEAVQAPEQFEVRSAASKIKEKIKLVIAKHWTELAGMTKQQYDLLSQNYINDPGMGNGVRVIGELFTQWKSDSGQEITPVRLREIALQIQHAFDSLVDADFFGDNPEDKAKIARQWSQVTSALAKKNLSAFSNLLQHQVTSRSIAS